MAVVSPRPRLPVHALPVHAPALDPSAANAHSPTFRYGANALLPMLLQGECANASLASTANAHSPRKPVMPARAGVPL
jgi:hypothetical protein